MGIGGIRGVYCSVLAVVRVVQDHGPARKVDLGADEAALRGLVHRREGVRSPALAQEELAVAGKLEVLADGQRVLELEGKHALARLVVGIDRGGCGCRVTARDIGHRKVDGCGRGERVFGAHDGHAAGRRGRQLRHPEELAGGPSHPDGVTDDHGGWTRVTEDEDPLGGRRARVSVSILLWEEEAAELPRALRLVVADDGRLDGERPGGHGLRHCPGCRGSR